MKVLVELVLLVHLAWYIWVVFGVLFTRGRIGLSAFHILSLIWGISVQMAPWGCPLTLAEQSLRSQAAGYTYTGGFALHYLDKLVNPKIPPVIYLCGVFAVCGGSLLIYLVRMIKALNGRGQKIAVSFAAFVVVFGGAVSLLQVVVQGATIADILHFSVIPKVKGSDGSQTGIASFLGNFTIPSTSGVVVGLVRQADCSLSLISGGYTIGSSGFTQTVLATNYERTMHNSASLTTAPNAFPSGCSSPTTGFGTRPVVYVGKTTSGVTVFAAVSDDPIASSSALYIMNVNASSISFQDMPTAKELTTADLNGDGNGDLVILNNVETTAGSVTVKLGNADGTFGSNVIYPTAGIAAIAAVVDDINNDGKLDIVVATDDQHISVLTGKGDGTFNSSQSFSASLPGNSNPISTPINKVITADINNDGKKDIICSNGLLLIGNGDGTFTTSSTPAFPYMIATTSTGPQLSSGDLNKDGNLDLVVNTGGAIYIWLGDGRGAFSGGNAYASISNSGWVTVADLDGDGNLDIYSGIANGGYFGGDHSSPAASYALMGNGDGTFVGAPIAPGSYNGSNLGDVNGDGVPDLITNTTGQNNTAVATFTVQLGTGKGTFTSASTVIAPASFPATTSALTSQATITNANTIGATSYAVADVNGDGEADLVFVDNGLTAISGSSGQPITYPTPIYFVALNKGDGTIAAPIPYNFPQIAPASSYDVSVTATTVQIADFNHDGHPDLLFTHNDQGGGPGTTPYNQGFAILTGKGDGTFSTTPILTTTYSSAKAPTSVFVATVLSTTDLNGDGKPDLIVNAPGTVITNFQLQTALQIYIGNGDGTFKTPTSIPVADEYGLPVVADFDKDGRLDLAFLAETSASQAELVVAPGNGDGTFGLPTVFNLPGGDAIRGAGLTAADFDKDGNVDLALIDSNPFSGVFYGKGDGTFTSVPYNGNIIPKDLINFGTGGASGAISVATDLNKDGKPDILAGNTSLLNLYGSAPVVTPPASTTIAVSASTSSVPTGSSITFTATITAAPGSSSAASGIVTFMDGTKTLGTGTLNSNVATYTTSTLSAGAHSITAVYAGDASFSGSTSSPFSLTVTAASVIPTTTALTSSATSAVSGTSVSFTAQVSPGSGTAVPTGIVTFMDGATTLAMSSLDGTGKAVFSTSALTAGSHAVQASYGGATAFGASTSTTVGVTITSSPTPDFAISLSPATSSVTHGSSVTTMLSITPANGFNLATTLTCSGAPTGDTCTIAPASVTPNGTASTAIVTLQTSAAASLRSLQQNAEWVATLPLGLVGTTALFGLRFGRRRHWPMLLAAVVAFAALGTITGCGGRNSVSPASTTATLTLTATSGSLSHSATWTVTVQ